MNAALNAVKESAACAVLRRLAGLICASMLAALLLNGQRVLAMLLRLLHVLRPLLFGVLFASMLEPSYERLRADLTAFAEKRRLPSGWIRPAALTGAILPPVLILISLLCVLVPQAADSTASLMRRFLSFLQGISKKCLKGMRSRVKGKAMFLRTVRWG